MATINSISGSSRIKDTYTTIYNNDNALNVDLIALEDRVDNIVSQAGDDNTEIVDARQSAVYGETFATLDGRLENHEADTATDDVHGLLSAGRVIEETGSNANGEYIRFSDGMQICTRSGFSITVTSSVILQGGWALPASFIDTNYYASLSAPSASADWTDPGVRSLISYQFSTVQTTAYSAVGFFLTTSSTATVSNVKLFAIGRWK